MQKEPAKRRMYVCSTPIVYLYVMTMLSIDRKNKRIFISIAAIFFLLSLKKDIKTITIEMGYDTEVLWSHPNPELL